MLQEVMRAYQENTTRMLILSAISFAGGYGLYIYSFLLTIREKKAPFPFWMHVFYLSHDVTGAVVFARAAYQNQWFWFFSGTSIALLVWNCFEIFNIVMGIKHERQEIWGRYYASPVTVRQAVERTAWLIALMFAIVNIFRVFMQDEVMFKWFSLTNAIMAVFPGFLWNERRSRAGSSVGLAILIVLVSANTFLPPGFGMFTTASPFFDQPWFYIAGVLCTAFSIRHLLMLLKYPPKEAVAGQKKPIW
ncbi:hypothetical protein F0U59_24255 [Archangium gephyra]|nr:hypothetical protein F0U59_24255 [Archangium gephyra]